MAAIALVTGAGRGMGQAPAGQLQACKQAVQGRPGSLASLVGQG